MACIDRRKARDVIADVKPRSGDSGVSIEHRSARSEPRQGGGSHSGARIEAFLRDVEARAYRIALVHIRDRDEALDIVQDAMIRLVRRYADRPSEEWPPLFYRILQNRIRDIQRRRAVRSRVLSFFGGTASEEEHDPIAEAPAPQRREPARAGDGRRRDAGARAGAQRRCRRGSARRSCCATSRGSTLRRRRSR